MHWIKEVEVADSVDGLMSSSSIRCIQIPNFEVLDARIASALNRIIHNSHFKRRISLEEQKAQKQDRFLRGRQIVKRIVTNEQHLKFVQSILMHEREIRENRKLQQSADVGGNQAACSRGGRRVFFHF